MTPGVGGEETLWKGTDKLVSAYQERIRAMEAADTSPTDQRE